MKNTLSVAACGSSQFGQSTQTSDISVPCEFVVPSIDSICAGGWHSAVLCANENVAFWGSNMDQQIPKVQSTLLRSPTNYQIPLDYQKIALGSKHTVILTKSGAVQYYGLSGNMGKQTTVTKVKNIFAKFEFTAILLENNKIIVLGYEQKACKIILKNDEIPKIVEPTPFGTYVLCESSNLYFFDGENEKYVFNDVISVASSRTKAIFLKKDGRVFYDGKGKTLQVPGITDVPIKVFAGGAHYGCVTLTGECFTWGCGTRGQLGNGHFSYEARPSKVVVDEKKCIIDAAAGEEHTVFLICKDDVFTPMIDKEMKEQTLPAGVSSAMIRDCSFIPPDFDIKF